MHNLLSENFAPKINRITNRINRADALFQNRIAQRVNEPVARLAVQCAIKAIKAGIRARLFFERGTGRLNELATPLTNVRKLEIFLSGHGEHE